MKNYTVVSTPGPNCPRCKQPTQRRERTLISREGQYAYWFYCINPRCKTSTIIDRMAPVAVETKAQPLTPEQRRLERIAIRKQRERKLGNFAETARPNPNVPIGWPSDGSVPPWATAEELAQHHLRQRPPWED